MSELHLNCKLQKEKKRRYWANIIGVNLKCSLILISFLMNKNNNSDNKITDASNNVQQSPFSTTNNCPSSPAQGRSSLREFEEQMASLRKENFNLKLRVYFLEEKPSPSHHGIANSSSCPNINSIESISKQNIDLKVKLFVMHDFR